MRSVIRLIPLLFALLAFAAGGASAEKPDPPDKPAPPEKGDLDRFEDQATKDEKHHDSDDSDECGENGDEESDDDLGLFEGLAWELGRLMFYSGAYGGIGSWVRVHGDSSEEAVKAFPRREIGEPLIPFLALEGTYQFADRDVSSATMGIEVGYGPVGFEYRATEFRESDPVDRMTLARGHVLYRMSFSPQVGIDFGAGWATLSGNRETTGFSVTLPVKVYPWRNVGVEFRPAWTRLHENTLGDYSLALVARHSVVSVSAGYRWVSNGASVIDGPVLGFAFHF